MRRMQRRIWNHCTAGLMTAVLLGTSMLTGCGPVNGGKDDTDDGKETESETPSETSGGNGEYGYVTDENAVQITLALDKRYQKWQGWGAGFTWYSDWAARHVDSEEIFDYLFSDLQLTTLRFRNTYKYDSLEDDFTTEKRYYEEALERATANGEELTVLLTAWSPAGYLKSTGAVEGESTLAKNENGEYMYEELGTYFADAIAAYADWGVPIDVLSIQNELEFAVDYDCCLYDYEESEERACYADAYLATYYALQERYGADAPKMIGPESMTIDSYMIETYMAKVLETEPDSVYGICHHLYAGGNSDNPGSFRQPMEDVYNAFPDTHRWMTEYFGGNPMQMAEIIMRALVNENVDCYIYWDGVWESGSGLIGLDYDRTVPYVIHEQYYIYKHFCKLIRPGYERVNSFIKGDSSFKMQSCVFISEDGSKIAAVVLNPTNEDVTIQVNIPGYDLTDSIVYLSNCQEGYDYTTDFYQESGSLSADHTFTIPANSMVTIDMTGVMK